MSKRIVVSLGGSLIAPEEIDTEFLTSFREFILSYIQKGYSFVLITGGGKVCRKYQAALKDMREVETEDLDWMGIETTRTNAMLVKLLFKEEAHPEVILDPKDAAGVESDVIVAAGWKPGASTDYDAVEMALITGAESILNLSNTDYVYTADPRIDPTAEKVEVISWEEYRKLIPTKWMSGSNTPFDPIASKLADEHNLQVCVINGKNLEAIGHAIDNMPFAGTMIS